MANNFEFSSFSFFYEEENHHVNQAEYHGGINVCFKDIPRKGIPCACVIVEGVLAVLTFFLCLNKLIRLQLNSQSRVIHKLIFAAAAIHVLLLSVHWLYTDFVQLNFTSIFLLVIEYLLVCVFFGSLAAYSLNQEHLVSRIIYPSAFVGVAYFSGVYIYALASVEKSSSECLEFHWLLFSASQLFLAQVFLIVGIFLHRKMNKYASMRNVQALKKIYLWSLIFAFEVAAVTSFSYDAILLTATNCNTYFGEPSSFSYNFVSIIHRLVTLLLPVWVLLLFVGDTTISPQRTQLTSPVRNPIRTSIFKHQETSPLLSAINSYSIVDEM